MEDTVDEMTLRQETSGYLFKIGSFLSSICPPASRFYMSNFEKRHHEFPDSMKNKSKHQMYCCHCGTIFTPNNCNIRMEPRQRLNCHIKKILKMERNEHWKLNSQQKKKLRRFYSSTSKVVYKCLLCKKPTSYAGSKTNGISVRTSDTPAKLKLNRCDVNAGLFIPSPIVTDGKEKKNLDTSNISTADSTSTVESSASLNISNNTKVNMNNSSKHKSSPTSKVTPDLNSKKQASAKRKKTLLAQILDREQNKKKKTTLSSFLVSL